MAYKRTARERLGDWDDIRLVAAVADGGSFSTAARRLGVNHSTLVRRIDALEQRLGARLFDRHSRGVRLTPAALGAWPDIAAIVSATNRIETRLAGIDGHPAGVVRVTATEGIAGVWLVPRLTEFQVRNPDILIEILTTSQQLDLATREADIAIRLAEPREPELIRRKVGVMRFALFAASSYVAAFGKPRQWDDLLDHRLVDHDGYHANRATRAWAQLTEIHPRVQFRTGSSYVYNRAVGSGHGIGLFPTYQDRVMPELIKLDVSVDCSAEIYVVSHEATRENARTRILLSHITELFETDGQDWFS